MSAQPAVPSLAPPSGDAAIGALIVFAAATLLVSAAVVGASVLGQWWLLVPTMLVDFAATFGVIVMIIRLFRDDGEPAE